MSTTARQFITEITFSRNVKPDKLRNYRGKGNLVMNRYKEKPIIFKGGVYKTSDKQEINSILRSEEMRRGDISLATPRELVEQYLSGDDPDRLTEEMLKNVSKDGLVEIARSVGVPVQTHGNYPNVIRSMVVDQPITNELYHIIQNHKTDSPEVNLLKDFEESGRVYKNGPWYKFKKGDKEDSKKDYSMGKTEGEAHRWIAENKTLIDEVELKSTKKDEEPEDSEDLA